jgi:hypothetical protein
VLRLTACCVPCVQPTAVTELLVRALPGPTVPAPPADTALAEHEAPLAALRARLASARAAAARGSGAGAMAATSHDAAERLAVAADKLTLRLFDGALKQERLDRALQLIAGCAASPSAPGTAAYVPLWFRFCSFDFPVFLHPCQTEYCGMCQSARTATVLLTQRIVPL